MVKNPKIDREYQTRRMIFSVKTLKKKKAERADVLFDGDANPSPFRDRGRTFRMPAAMPDTVSMSAASDAAGFYANFSPADAFSSATQTQRLPRDAALVSEQQRLQEMLLRHTTSVITGNYSGATASLVISTGPATTHFAHDADDDSGEI